MKRIAQLLVAALASAPLFVAAQTTPAATPSPSPSPAVNGPPPTTTPSQSSSPRAAGMPNATPANDGSTSDTTTTPKTRRHAVKKDTTKPGDAPTYPAPAPDNTPTK